MELVHVSGGDMELVHVSGDMENTTWQTDAFLRTVVKLLSSVDANAA